MGHLNECNKRTDYYVTYNISEPGVEVYNKLEDCKYVTDEKNNVILTGAVGEEWVTTKEKLDKTYKRNKDKDSGYAYPIGSEKYFYEFSDKDQDIETARGSILKAKTGDAIVYANNNGKPNLNDRWVVDKTVFNNTYNYKSNEK